MSNRKVPRMTRGHYIFIADALSEMADSYGLDKEQIANSFASRLFATNPRFNKSRFVDRVTNRNVKQLKEAAKRMRDMDRAA